MLMGRFRTSGGTFTVYSSTCRCNSASCFRRLAASSFASGSASGSAFSTRRLRPITSSARRCCLSAGVSVQSVLSTFLGGAVDRENWRGLLSFVGSSAVYVSSLVRTVEPIDRPGLPSKKKKRGKQRVKRLGFVRVEEWWGRVIKGESSALDNKSD